MGNGLRQAVNGLRAGWDQKRQGTHYADRMQRILSVCQDCGLLWHDERAARRDGSTEVRRVDDVEPAGNVLVTPQYEKYGLRVNPRVLSRLRTMAMQFAYALNVPNTAVEVDGNVVYVRVPRPQGEHGDILLFEQAWRVAPDIPQGNVLLGVDEEQQQLVLELVAPTNVHAAVIGMTGSGKSSLMRTMILSALRIGGARVALFDPSNGMRPLSGHPAIWRGGMFRTPEDCEAGLEALTRLLGRTDNSLIYAFVDEVPELVAQRPKIREHLARLAQAGRHAGIHLVLGAQHPLASELGPTTLRNVPVRLVGRVADRSAAYNATGRADTGVEFLRGRGDFVVVNGAIMRHFQAAYVSPEMLAECAARFPPRPPRVPVSLGHPSGTRTAARQGEVPDAQSADGESSLGGRPLDDIPEGVVREIQHYVLRHGREPSSNWVYRLTHDTQPSGGFNRDKTRRAILAALDGLALGTTGGPTDPGTLSGQNRP
jgi:DNA segregation ATPase FtsK/SpoIIIE, S-DNA-T family